MTSHERLLLAAVAGIRGGLASFESPYLDDAVYGFVFSCHYEDMEPQSCVFTRQGLRAALEHTLPATSRRRCTPPPGKPRSRTSCCRRRTRSSTRCSTLAGSVSFSETYETSRCLDAEREAVVSRVLEQALVACRDLGLGVTIVCNVFVPDDEDGNERRLVRLNDAELLRGLGLTS